MEIPVYLYRRKAIPEMDENGVRYLVARNGNFVERKSAVMHSCARVEDPFLDLDSQTEYCTLRCGKIPPVMQRSMLAFFAQAHAIHGGEAALVLLFDLTHRRYRWHCPLQVVDLFETATGWYTSDQIEFDNPLDLPGDYVHFGDAHLHPGPPNPSALDIADDQDGLHIIVGNIRTGPSYHVTFVVDGVRFHVPPEVIFEDPACQAFSQAPAEWLQRLRIRKTPLKNHGRNDGRAADQRQA